MRAVPCIRCAPHELAFLSPVLIALLIAIGTAPMEAAEPTQPIVNAAFSFRDISDTSLGLWEGEKPVLVYNFGKMTLPGVRRAEPRAGYVHPIYGLDGEVLTDDFPEDHYHHHGLFWSWPHVKVGEREYDLWLGKGIRIDFVRWLSRDANGDRAKLGVENAWMVGDRAVMREVVRFDVNRASEHQRCVDIAFTWTPVDEPISLRGAEGKSYGGLTLRFAPNRETVITTPDGRTSDDLLITKLPWVDFSGRFADADAPSGAALFVHPEHADFPPEWMTRYYGVLAVGWPGVNERTLAVGEPVTCRYRLWIHRGMPDAEAIERAYNAYRSADSP